jgi:plastocyanin
MKQKQMINMTLATLSIVIASSSMASEIILNQQQKSFRLDGNKIEEISVSTGDTIRFKNEDPFFHNIFSLSDLKTFDLGSFPKGQSKTVVFDKPGMVEVECAIHPEMYLEVTVK